MTEQAGTTEPEDLIARAIDDHVRHLCGLGVDRHPGTERNRAATDYVGSVLRSLGADVESLPFDVPEWRPGTGSLKVGAAVWPLHPGPFSLSAEGTGRLVEVSHAEGLAGIDAGGAVVLLHGEIARAQLVPRNYPWYSSPDDIRIADALEDAKPLAVVAITGKNPQTTGALSPFPAIEEVGFPIPTAYVGLEDGERLLAHVGEEADVRIASETVPSTGVQPIARMRGAEPGRVVIGGHVDTKPDTPGALDNAAGVATLLAVAELLAGTSPRHTIEFVPFNGEDHTLSPGEVAYLDEYGDLSDVLLMINIDAAGLAGGRTACSSYGLDDETRTRVADAISGFDSIVEGPEWPASDHMIFAMRGVPALAITSEDITTAMRDLLHTPADTPDKVDARLLADAARFIAQVVANL